MEWKERERERERRQSESPRAHARKTIMMDKLRLVPHVRSERKTTEGEGRRQGRETAAKGGSPSFPLSSALPPLKGEEKKKRRKEKEKEKNGARRGEDKRNAGACTAVFHHSTAFHFIPVATPRTPVFPPL